MPCLGPPSAPIKEILHVPSHEHDFVDAQRIFEAFTIRAIVFGPSTTAVDLTFPPDLCDCPTPRFDAVTLAGVRHSEFCCACDRPGSNDHTC